MTKDEFCKKLASDLIIALESKSTIKEAQAIDWAANVVRNNELTPSDIRSLLDKTQQILEDYRRDYEYSRRQLEERRDSEKVAGEWVQINKAYSNDALMALMSGTDKIINARKRD